MSEKEEKDQPIPFWQKMFDNVWVLFLLSLLISLVVYNLWGLYDLMHVPPAP